MSSPGFPFSIGGSVGIGFAGGSIELDANIGAAAQGQRFATISLPNTRLALYTLSIRNPDEPLSAHSTFTFPLSPAALSREFTAMNNTYDVAGNSKQFGVQRVADLYGNTPVTFVIQGTTGWKFHGTDGYAFTGVEAIAAIQKILNDFAGLNKGRQADNNPSLYTLEFYDYFYDSYWQVVPVGRQIVSQNQQRPLLFDYAFRLAGIKDVGAPLPPNADDPVLNALALSQPQAVGVLSAALTISLNQYGANTAGTLGITI